MKALALLLAADGFPDEEIKRVLDEVDASIKRQADRATEEATTVLKEEGLDGLRRRLERMR